MLTIVAMAALGLGVDARAVVSAGPRVTATVTVSVAILGAIGLAVVKLFALH